MAEMGNKFSDNSLRKPAYREIYEGSEVDVINRQGVLQGRGVLLKRCPSKTTTDNLPYVKNELDASDNKSREEYSHIWSYERWTVQWVRHTYLRPGDRSCVEVNYYIHTRINHDSNYDIHFPAQDNYNKYIFVEENGVLITHRGAYTKPAVKALNKVHKIFGGEVIMYSPEAQEARHRCEKFGVYPRILSFLDTSLSFEDAVAQYVEAVDSKDFMILAGHSRIDHARAIQIDAAKGICLKKESSKKP